MTITTYTDREIKLQKELALEKQLAQLNGEIASDLKADKLRLEAERDTLRQQLAEAKALIEVIRKHEHVIYMSADFTEAQLKQYGDDRAREAMEMAAKACDECVQYPSITPEHCADHIRALAKEIK